MDNNRCGRIVSLMVDNLDERVEGEVAAFKPADTETEFVVMTDDAAVKVDAADHTFRALDRGSSTDYIRLKKFFREVGLEFRAV